MRRPASPILFSINLEKKTTIENLDDATILESGYDAQSRGRRVQLSERHILIGRRDTKDTFLYLLVAPSSIKGQYMAGGCVISPAWAFHHRVQELHGYLAAPTHVESISVVSLQDAHRVNATV